jgi:hypothetical protein
LKFRIAALNALPSVKRAGLTATVSGPGSSTLNVTWTPPQPVTDLVTIIPTSLNAAGTFEIGSSAVTQVGIDGFYASGSSFFIDVYGLCFNDMHIKTDGTMVIYQNFQQ